MYSTGNYTTQIHMYQLNVVKKKHLSLKIAVSSEQ